MKMPIILPLLFFTWTAHATFNEFECKFNTRSSGLVEIEIDRAVEPDSMRTATLLVNRERPREFQVTGKYNKTTRKMSFWGQNFDLEIQIWPHISPKFGRTYRADFKTNVLPEGPNFLNVTCRYYGY